MTASDTLTIATFEPPGPGTWEQDPVHFPRPMTLYFQETHPPPFKTGTNDFARFYGLLIDGLQMSYVNGFGYKQVLPAPASEIPQRFARAEQLIKNSFGESNLSNGTRTANRSPLRNTGSCRPWSRTPSQTPSSLPI